MSREHSVTTFKGWARHLGMSVVSALLLLLFSTAVALSTNYFRGKKHGGLPLIRRAPFDLYTECPEISDELKQKKASELPLKSSRVLYVDARGALAYCQGHIPKALFLPMYETEMPSEVEVGRLKEMKGYWIVVYGDPKLKSGQRLASALLNAQVRGVFVLEGGLAAWKAAKRPISSCLPKEITLAEIDSHKGEVRFIDGREEEKHKEGCIPSSVLFTYDGVLPPDAKALSELARHKDALLVVYDQGGEKPAGPDSVDAALGAASELLARGMKNTRILKKGLDAWIEAGRKLQTTGEKKPKEQKAKGKPESKGVEGDSKALEVEK